MRLHDYLDYHAREHGERTCIAAGTRQLDFAGARREADRFARALAASGIRKGDRFAFLAKNCLEYPIAYLGASKAGAVPVPLNYRLAPPELAWIANDAEAKLLIARGELVDAIDAARGELKTVERFVSLDAPARPGWRDHAAWLAERGGSGEGPPDVEIGPDDVLYQMYTSGTTGHPKGARLTHRAVLTNLQQQQVAFDIVPGDRVLVVAPLYHAAAGITFMGNLVFGCTSVLHEDFDPRAVVRALSEEEIARVTLVPAMIQASLVLVPDVAERRYEKLRIIVYGASPIAADVLRRAMQVFRCDFAQAYGMTETTAVLTVLSPEDHRRALAGREDLLLSAGRAVVGTELRIVDEQDQPVANGAIGEICARGGQLMQDYWNLPEASAKALRGGWMHTGDAGILDADGYLHIQDRVKDMIVSGGENVYPREVENVLFAHAAVADVAVIGVPDERWGEAVKAIVVLREGQSATAEELMDFCRGRLGGYKRPRSVDFASALPRNASGKVLKKDLREKYWTGHRRRVG
jgi:fatty-acyl-CoA synthase